MEEITLKTTVDIDAMFEILLIISAATAIGKLDISPYVAEYIEDLIPSLSTGCLNRILRATHDASYMKHEVNQLYKNINIEIRKRKERGYDHLTSIDIDVEDE